MIRSVVRWPWKLELELEESMIVSAGITKERGVSMSVGNERKR